MTRTHTTLISFVLLLLAIAGGVAWYLVTTHREAVGPVSQTASTTPEDLTGEAIYTNGPYGFVIQYPEAAKVENSFSAFYHLGTEWRATPITQATGTPVVAIVTYDTKSDHAYPRYYSTMVRIGVSTDKKEVAGCLTSTPNQGETPLPDATFGGVTWKAFAFESAGMMQYAKGISYRTVHEGKCVALEQVAAGSSYRDDAPSKDSVSDDVLKKHYDALDAIVKSFLFVHP